MNIEIKPHIGTGIGSHRDVDTGLDGIWVDGRRVALSPRSIGSQLIMNSDYPISDALMKQIRKSLDERDGLTPADGVSDREILRPPRLEDDSDEG